MATLPTLENVTRYKTTNSGTSWDIVDSNSAGYIYTEDNATRLCYSFTYTPTGGTRANKITLTCKLLATGQGANNVERKFTVKLYKGTYPTGTAITDASNVVSIHGHDYTYCSFAITIPDDVMISEETDLCIQIYSSDGTNQGWTGNVDIDEVSMYNVTLDANGHGVAPDTVTWSGSDVVLPELTADGYIFLGWSESSTATTGITGTYTPTSDVTLYAVWIVDAIVVNFDDGLYTITIESVDEIINLDDVPEQLTEGKTHVGWYNTNNVKAEAGNAWSTVVIEGEHHIHLYSKWDYDKAILEGQQLADIADAIREVLGQSVSVTYLVDEMPDIIKTRMIAKPE